MNDKFKARKLKKMKNTFVKLINETAEGTVIQNEPK